MLVAPDVEAEALEVLRTGAAWGKNRRVLACGDTGVRAAECGARLTDFFRAKRCR